MVERSQTGGWMPGLYEPIKKAGQKLADWFAPRSDAALTTSAYEIAMELPGVALENIEIAVQDSMLLVSGEKVAEREESGKNFLFSEREYGAFQRAFDGHVVHAGGKYAFQVIDFHGTLNGQLPI